MIIKVFSKESWVPKNWCFWTVMLEKTLESPLDCKEIQQVHPKGNQSWMFIGRTDFWSWNSNTLATWCEDLTHWKRPWCWERLKVGGKGDDRGWDGWMASPTQQTWVWVKSGRWWWTGRPGMLQSMGLQRVGHDWETELNWKVFHEKLTKVDIFRIIAPSFLSYVPSPMKSEKAYCKFILSHKPRWSDWHKLPLLRDCHLSPESQTLQQTKWLLSKSLD